jgi:hypothetical protein
MKAAAVAMFGRPGPALSLLFWRPLTEWKRSIAELGAYAVFCIVMIQAYRSIGVEGIAASLLMIGLCLVLGFVAFVMWPKRGA